MVADAQTSGGLLVSLSKENAKKFLEYYNIKSPIPAIQIGTVHDSAEYMITIS
jgi:selenophosphate synthase